MAAKCAKSEDEGRKGVSCEDVKMRVGPQQTQSTSDSRAPGRRYSEAQEHKTQPPRAQTRAPAPAPTPTSAPASRSSIQHHRITAASAPAPAHPHPSPHRHRAAAPPAHL
eukprot:scaffold1148_cov108-Isochrysis_galbana.AAC.6